MTGQIPDTIIYENEEYAIAGIKDDNLFNPEFIGINLSTSCTACWRGFTLNYEVTNQTLLLQGVLLNTKDEPTPINGIKPIKAEDSFFDYLYENLD